MSAILSAAKAFAASLAPEELASFVSVISEEAEKSATLPQEITPAVRCGMTTVAGHACKNFAPCRHHDGLSKSAATRKAKATRAKQASFVAERPAKIAAHEARVVSETAAFGMTASRKAAELCRANDLPNSGPVWEEVRDVLREHVGTPAVALAQAGAVIARNSA